MRPAIRFLAGVALGGGALAGYLLFVGPGEVFDRASAVTPWALALVVGLVAAEGVVDGVGVWPRPARWAGGSHPARVSSSRSPATTSTPSVPPVP